MAADLLVSTEWLAEHLTDANVRVVDMRGSVVTTQVAPGVEQADYRGVEHEYLAGHIPGAVYVDWTADIIDPDDPVPVQIAPQDRFAEAMAERGIGDETLVIAVDHSGRPVRDAACGGPSIITGTIRFACSTAAGTGGSRKGGRSRRAK